MRAVIIIMSISKVRELRLRDIEYLPRARWPANYCTGIQTWVFLILSP